VHPSIFKGVGQDFEDFRLYQPGDDIRNIDWKSSAKNGLPVVKRFRADSNTNVALVVDSGREMMTRSTSGEKKIDILQTVCETFGYLSSMRGDAVGIVAGDAERIMNERAKLSYGEVKVTLNKVQKIASNIAPESSYNRVLAFATQFFTKRTFLILVFDEAAFRTNHDIMLSIIRRLNERHDIFAVSFKDINPFDEELPKISGKVIDIDTKNYLPSYFRRDAIARLVKRSIGNNRTQLKKSLKRLGVAHINVGSSEEFFRKMSHILQRREVARYR
jgi:uncharacterized protein (DUF58 family)